MSLLLGIFMSVVGILDTNSQSVLPKHYTQTLDNHLQVVVIPLRNGSNVVETNVFYKVGSRNEKMGKSGIAHMLEHLSFKSTKNLKAGEFDEIVKGFGGVNNATTSFDYTRYFIKSSAENIDKSLKLFAELMCHLSLLDEEFQPERNVVAEERLWRTDNSPTGYLYFRFFNTAFIYHPYHWTPIGFMEDIQSWNIEDIRSFYKTYYQPQNAIIVVSGDIEPEVVFKSAKQYFGEIKNTTKSIPEVTAKEPKQDGMRRAIVRKDSQLEHIAMGYKIPNFQSQDQVALNAIGEILGSGKSSLFQQEIIDKQRIATNVSAFSWDLRDDGVFLIIATAKAGIDGERLEREIHKMIEKIKAGDISQEDLQKVKVNTKAQFIYELESASNVAGLFGDYFVKGDIKPLLNYERNIENLSVEKIKEVANKYFIDDNLTVLILKNKEMK